MRNPNALIEIASLSKNYCYKRNVFLTYLLISILGVALIVLTVFFLTDLKPYESTCFPGLKLELKDFQFGA